MNRDSNCHFEQISKTKSFCKYCSLVLKIFASRLSGRIMEDTARIPASTRDQEMDFPPTSQTKLCTDWIFLSFSILLGKVESG